MAEAINACLPLQIFQEQKTFTTVKVWSHRSVPVIAAYDRVGQVIAALHQPLFTQEPPATF